MSPGRWQLVLSSSASIRKAPCIIQSGFFAYGFSKITLGNLHTILLDLTWPEQRRRQDDPTIDAGHNSSS